MTKRRYWASRPDKNSLPYFWHELQNGRLRQGWGYLPEQDLRKVAESPWDAQSDDQRQTSRQHRMLGGDGGWQDGDVVLMPNMPTWGMFALAEIAGPYDFKIDPGVEDYGHIRPIRLLTPNGVPNFSGVVSGAIRSTLRNAGRTWSVDHLTDDIEAVIAHAEDPALLTESREIERTNDTLADAIDVASKSLLDRFRDGLNRQLRAAEWEVVIGAAARTRFPTAEVRHTGGPAERGADLVIEIPNPFGGATWIVVVQVKDYDGEIGPEVAQQIREAVRTRSERSEDNRIQKQVIAAVLACTNAMPSAALENEISSIECDLNVPVSVIEGKDLMQLILRGSLQQRFERG